MTSDENEFSVIRFNDSQHRQEVVGLWNRVFGYETAHNEPNLVIDKKTAAGDGLFFVASAGDTTIGTVMAGYDGHRGWIYSLAVSPDMQHRGYGSILVTTVEEELIGRGCLKVNLQIMEGNEQVKNFYEANGYVVENRVSMGKRLPMHS